MRGEQDSEWLVFVHNQIEDEDSCQDRDGDEQGAARYSVLQALADDETYLEQPLLKNRIRHTNGERNLRKPKHKR